MPNKLYNYLRRHQWSDAIPEEFLLQWKTALNKNDGLSENELFDFQSILQRLGIQNEVIERVIDGEKVSQTTRTAQTHNNSISIPPVSDFSEFKLWMLQRIAYIEKRIGIANEKKEYLSDLVLFLIKVR